MEPPPKHYLSVNAAAKACKIDIKVFWDLVRAFERHCDKLPAEGSKPLIPTGLLYVFRDAHLAMHVRNLSPWEGMNFALRIWDSDGFGDLLAAVQDRQAFLNLSGNLSKTAVELRRLVEATSRDNRQEVSSLTRQNEALESRLQKKSSAVRAGFMVAVLFGVACGGGGTWYLTSTQMNAIQHQLNQATYMLAHRLDRIQQRVGH